MSAIRSSPRDRLEARRTAAAPSRWMQRLRCPVSAALTHAGLALRGAFRSYGLLALDKACW